MRIETFEGQEGARPSKRGILGSIGGRDQPYDHRDVSGCHLGTILDPVGSIWDPFGPPLGSHFAHFSGVPFFIKKGGPKTTPDFKPESVLGAILAPFFIIFHHFSGNLKNRFCHYLTVLSKVFALQRLSFWGPVSVPFSVRFWDPQKVSPRAVAESPGVHPGATFWSGGGRILGGGFVDSSRFR